MAATENRRLVERMLAGEIDWLEQWSSDGLWSIPGSTRWSGTYQGKADIGRNLLGPLSAEMESLGTFHIDRVIAEGNHVVVQGHASGRITKSGKPYNNTYCLVYEIIDGKIRELTEYCDTELVNVAFGAKSPSPMLGGAAG
jgi:ketosteroid isomerase-like protein